jgi:DNA helicase HerA-like ATPase
MADFAQTIATAYATDGAAVDLGRGVHDGAVALEATVKLPLRMVNRHGLIAGATGTGKTKTLQGLAEQLSAVGVPVFVADVKGDLSGVAEPGDPASAAAKRAADLGLQFQARGFPVEFFALGGIGPGIPIRATVSDVHDLMRTAPDGRGIISCLELPAVQDKPKLFSTALMWLLAELFEALPEAGDLDKPKLAFFFDEAHLLFDGASKAFLTSVAQTVRLIRSKGVGVYFITQTPKDVPSEILGQLGNRVQHALRAFTPDDAKALKATVSTFPKSRSTTWKRC